MQGKGAKDKIHDVISWLEGVVSEPHKFGGTEYRIGKREIGHIHGDYLVDIPFTNNVKSEILKEGKAFNHHILLKSGWVSVYLKENKDVENE